jgi:hypothetical protein
MYVLYMDGVVRGRGDGAALQSPCNSSPKDAEHSANADTLHLIEDGQCQLGLAQALPNHNGR